MGTWIGYTQDMGGDKMMRKHENLFRNHVPLTRCCSLSNACDMFQGFMLLPTRRLRLSPVTLPSFLRQVLLLGSFPVVRSSSLDSLYNGLPVLIVQQWKEIAVQMLASARHQFLSSSDIHQEKLFFEYWQNLILAFQQIQMDIHA
mmetsp:Transcript_23908/g.60020  ORF Transcript_23908/g.60020 Transcript_23908/m.60020 type:complete len:145 (+) Transcript_23908:1211-1645(+)